MDAHLGDLAWGDLPDGFAAILTRLRVRVKVLDIQTGCSII